MATIENVMDGARRYLRDRPKFFVGSSAMEGTPRVLELPHPNVDAQQFDMWAVAAPNTTYAGYLAELDVEPDVDRFLYTLLPEEGFVRIEEPPTEGWGETLYFNFQGFYFSWVSDQDLRFFAEIMIAEHSDDNPTLDIHEMSDSEVDALCLGTAVEACWSMLAEMARDIDVSTPEGIGLPLTQRYRQLEGLTMTLTSKYKQKSALLGVGLDRVKVGQLRRQSRSTYRLVPIYQMREWDDAKRPQRVFPKVDQEAPSTPPPGFTPAKVVTGFFENEGVWVPVQDDR